MLFKNFIQFIKSNNLFSHNESVLLAVSSGLDSTVMAHLFARSGYQFAIAHCNFGLRGENSDGDGGFADQIARIHKVPFFLTSFPTEEYARSNGISIQMAARDLRYQWFEEIRKNNGFDFVATAHHLDDQAETFLINLIRGTGIAGLHGIPVRNGKVVRPMMFATREDIEAYAKQHQISFREDQSNQQTKYIRNKIRHEILPVLTAINPDFPGNLTETIRKISDYEQIAEKALMQWQDDARTFSNDTLYIAIEKIRSSSHPATLLWFMTARYGFNQAQINDLLQCLNEPDEKTFTSSSHRITKERDRLVVSKVEIKHSDSVFYVDFPRDGFTINDPVPMHFQAIPRSEDFELFKGQDYANLDLRKLEFPLILRKWQHGDLFHPFGMKGKKRLSDYFTDLKFSTRQKEDTWLLCSGEKIVWVIGWRIDHRFRITSATNEILQINLPKFAPSKSN